MKTVLITLENLKLFLSDLKTWVADYFDSRIDSSLSDTSTNPVQNKVINDALSHMIWSGTSEEYAAALAAGELRPGQTVNITDDYEEIAYVECSYEDIAALFE